jgi:DNA-binding NarL/FixJ family response regulator
MSGLTLEAGNSILIADDSQKARSTIRYALERETEFQICGETMDGVEAVSKAKELTPDLIIIDDRMPRLNGIEAAGILRHTLPKIRILLWTMFAEDISENLKSVFQIDAVLAKSRGLTELVASVEEVLANSRHLRLEQ